ncbi:MAG TPA: MarR family transcriptional regulator [Trebonia sp.]|jgi:DNA-binding MarR family transcriptional regulator
MRDDAPRSLEDARREDTGREGGDSERAGQPGAQDDGLTDALVQVAFATMAVLNKAASDNDLSLTQLRVLGILRDRRLRMTTLAGYLGLEKSTLSGLVDRAAQRGLLRRAPSAGDRRAVDVFTTERGAGAAARVHAGIRDALTPLTGALTAPERRRLQALIEKMMSPNAPG